MTDSNREKIGHWARPDREWEVWDERYDRSTGERRELSREGWTAFHPYDGIQQAHAPFPSLEDALDYIAVMELVHADELEKWRRDGAA